MTADADLRSGRGGAKRKERAPAKPRKKRTQRLRRAIQALSLALFLFLLWSTAVPLPQSLLPRDLFLRLDPLVATAIPLTARQWIPSLAPGLGVLLVTLFLGRIFCGYICPMGITLDVVRYLEEKAFGSVERAKRASPPARALFGDDAAIIRNLLVPRHLKYFLLASLAGAALIGINLIFWAAPIPLITRFYALWLHPLLLFAGNEGLGLIRPAADSLGMPSLLYAQIFPRRFDTLYFLVFFFSALFWLERVRPRFWCRYLCPAGALLSLFSLHPFWRRRTTGCNNCGRCAVNCPTGAVAPHGQSAAHAECLGCRACIDACPSKSVAFSIKNPATTLTVPFAPPLPEKPLPAMLPTRRAFLAAAGAGTGIALTGLCNLDTLLTGDARGILWPALCIRPPGAVPESSFLDLCLRCGECMKVCPSNALQPTWFAAGAEGMFSPVLTARRGPCEPDCNACGRVCPTGALLCLPLREKRWAKMGTAVVLREGCLAWAEGRSCVVCQEVCPYGAIACRQEPGAQVPVPFVRAERCYGCGYCEYHCPVRVPAVVVRPLNALRLYEPRYEETARSAGLRLIPASQIPSSSEEPETMPQNGLPPGFSE